MGLRFTAKCLTLSMVFTLSIPAAAKLPTENTLALIDGTFICPEDLPNDEARDAANTLFLHLVMSLGNVTTAQLIEFRVRMLKSHNCTRTLETIAKQK